MNLRISLSPKEIRDLLKVLHLRGNVTVLFKQMNPNYLGTDVNPFIYEGEIVTAIWQISQPLFEQMRLDGCNNCFMMGTNYYWQRLDAGCEPYPESLKNLMERFGPNPIHTVL